MTGQPFEFSAADSIGYHDTALWYIDLVQEGGLRLLFSAIGTVYSDLGYPIYLSIIYTILGKNIIIVRIIKALLNAYTCILIFKIAYRNFGENVARISAIMAMLLPNFIYYCGVHVKEIEMVFLVVLFAEKADILIRSQKLSPEQILIPLVIGLLLFFFRTVLGIAIFASLLLALVLTSKKIINSTYRIIILIISGIVILLLLNSKLESEVTRYWGERSSNQATALNAYSNVKKGNKFSKYGKASVFAPIMLIAPVATMVNIENQKNQMFLNGGYFVRNIYSFFIFIALFALWKEKRLTMHVFLLSLTFSYLGILILSKFALSERFHLPIVPFLIILASYGITKIKINQYKYFNWYLIAVSVLIIGWNWFKLAGRGII